ncbi:MAG: TonB-dependent receptor [Bacteroidota bacterium]
MRPSRCVFSVLCLMLILGSLLTVQGQQTVQLLDAADEQPVAFAKVEILCDGEMVKQCLSNEKGVVALPESPCTAFVLNVEHLGYQPLQAVPLTGGSITLMAQEELNLDQVVITGQLGGTQAYKSVQKIKVLDEARIQRQAANNLAELLATQLNLGIRQDPVLGTFMEIQGLSGRNVKIMVDGVPVIGRLDGGIDLTQINLNQIERVELVEGPMSVEYGTNALGGVINLISKKADKRSWTLEASAYEAAVGGDYSIHEGHHNHSLAGSFRTKALWVQAQAGRNFFGGTSQEAGQRFRRIRPKDQYFGRLDLGNSYKKWSWKWSTQLFDEVMVNKGPLPDPNFYSRQVTDSYFNTLRHTHQLQATANLSEKYVVNGFVSYAYFRRISEQERVNLVDLSAEELTENTRTEEFGTWLSRASISRKAQDGSWLAWQAGYEVELENGEGQRIIGGRQNMENYALFANLELRPWKTLAFRPGVRWTDNSLYDAPITPAVHLRYEPVKGHTFRTSYARGFRAPTLKELYFEFIDVNHNIINNPDLLAEWSHNYRASYNFQHLWGKHLVKANVGAFHNRLENMIEYAFTGGENNEVKLINVGNFRTQGVETGVSYQSERLSFDLGMNVIGRYNRLYESRESLDESVSQFNYAPNFSANGSWWWRKVDIRFNLFQQYFGRRTGFVLLEDDEVGETFIDAYQIMDLTAMRRFWNKRIILTAGVRNIFDVTNVNANFSGGAHSGGGSQAIGLGRTVFVRLDVKLGSNN